MEGVLEHTESNCDCLWWWGKNWIPFFVKSLMFLNDNVHFGYSTNLTKSCLWWIHIVSSRCVEANKTTTTICFINWTTEVRVLAVKSVLRPGCDANVAKVTSAFVTCAVQSSMDELDWTMHAWNIVHTTVLVSWSGTNFFHTWDCYDSCHSRIETFPQLMCALQTGLQHGDQFNGHSHVERNHRLYRCLETVALFCV